MKFDEAVDTAKKFVPAPVTRLKPPPPVRRGTTKIIPETKHVTPPTENTNAYTPPTRTVVKEVYAAFMDILKSPILDEKAYAQILKVYKGFFKGNRYEDMYLDLNELLAMRARSDQEFEDICGKDYMLPNTKKRILNNRKIWQQMSVLETSWQADPTAQPKTAKERWSMIKKLMVAENNEGFLVSGKFIDQQHWVESQPDSKGRHLRGDTVGDEWLEVWKKSRVAMSFQDWAGAVGAVNNEDLVAYYEDSERMYLQIKLEKGLWVNYNGAVVDTSTIKQSSKELSKDGLVDCVLSLDDKLYCSALVVPKQMKAGEQRHSGALEAGPVKFAGELLIVNGNITEISIRSGHYRPTTKHLYEFLKFLDQSGVNINGIKIYGWSLNLISNDAMQWLQDYKLGINKNII